jgi:large subunit ribosomal protein L4e
MFLSRPTVSVFNHANPNEIVSHHPLPGVFTAPIRLDIVHFVHVNICKNTRQAHAVNDKAGMKHSAESWGTGRAVARIPRVSGSGTHRAGQAAFGNMCRKGRMFAPLKTWRRWHRKVNLKQKRHAAASALAASAITPLVQARGHRIPNIPHIPLVVDDKLESVEKTKDIISFLKRFGAYEDIERVIDSKAVRPGIGKIRNHRYKLRKGPLFVYEGASNNLRHAVKNLPGVEICNVHRLNLRMLAPGGTLGRFIIWTQSAFKALDSVFGSYRKPSTEKSGYHLHRTVLSNADIAKIINSDSIQKALRPARDNRPIHDIQKKNPFKNSKAMIHLNPYAKTVKDMEKKAHDEGQKRRKAALDTKRGISKSLTKEQKDTKKKLRKQSKAWLNGVLQHVEDSVKRDKAREGKEDAEAP